MSVEDIITTVRGAYMDNVPFFGRLADEHLPFKIVEQLPTSFGPLIVSLMQSLPGSVQRLILH